MVLFGTAKRCCLEPMSLQMIYKDIMNKAHYSQMLFQNKSFQILLNQKIK